MSDNGSSIANPTRSVGYLAHLIVRQSRRLLAEKLAHLGVVPGQLPALTHLYVEDGLTQTELARRAQVEQPTMANTIKRMARDRLLELRPDPTDRRKARVHLTARARDIRDEVMAAASEVNSACLGELSPEEAARCVDTMERIVESLAQAPNRVDPTDSV